MHHSIAVSTPSNLQKSSRPKLKIHPVLLASAQLLLAIVVMFAKLSATGSVQYYSQRYIATITACQGYASQIVNTYTAVVKIACSFQHATTCDSRL